MKGKALGPETIQNMLQNQVKDLEAFCMWLQLKQHGWMSSLGE